MTDSEDVVISSRRPLDGDSGEKHLTKEELARFFRAITDPRDRAMFTLTYWRGLRAAEIGKLSLASFDAKAGRLKFARLKGSRGGNDLLSPTELKALRAWLKVRGAKPGPLFPSNRGSGISRFMVFRLFARYAEAANIPVTKRHPHVLKHSIASHLVGKNVEVLKIQRWLGHKSINSTLVYAHLGQSEQDELARSLYDEL
jgi:site-specific recombinase XerD